MFSLVKELRGRMRGARAFVILPIGGAAALLGSVLQVKPILTFQYGQVNQFERERTHKRALARLKELVLEEIPRDGTGHLSVLHAAVPYQG